MEVIFIEDCPSNGYYVGDRVKVKAGFARNYLIPRKFAVEASSSSAKQVKHNLRLAEAKKEKLKVEAQQRADELKEVKLEFKLNVGEGGKVFGAVTGRDIATALIKAGKEVDRKQIRLSESIRGIGKYVVEVKLHSEVFAQIEVEVLAQKTKKAAKATEKKKGKSAKSADKATQELEAEASESDEEVSEVSNEETDATSEAEPVAEDSNEEGSNSEEDSEEESGEEE